MPTEPSCPCFIEADITVNRPNDHVKLDILQVRIAFSIACFYIAVVVLIVQTVFRYVKPDRQAGSRFD